MRLREAKKLLEVGCGGGINAELIHHYANPELELVLTDLSSKMLDITKERVSKSLPYTKIEVLQANAEELTFEDKSFDRYIASYVLHLTTNPEKMLSEAYRVLDDNGIAGFIVWGRKEHSPQFTLVPKVIQEVVGSLDTSKRSSFHLSDIDKTRELVLKAGFKKVYGYYVTTPIDVFTGKEFVERSVLGPSNATLMSTMDEEVKNKVLKRLEEEADLFFERGEVMRYEGLVIIAMK